MVSFRLLSILMATAVSAAPLLDERDLNLTKWSPDRKLNGDEIVLIGKDREEVIQVEQWHKLLESEGILPEAPEYDHDWIAAGANMSALPYDPEIHGHGPQKRDCAHTFSFVTDKTQRFVDWDVQMSPVVIGPMGGMDVTISKSYSVADSVSVSAGLSPTAIKSYLSASIGISYTRTWTTTQGYLIRGNVAQGYTGTVVSTPWTTRRYGRAFQGCPGSLAQTGTWTADSHEEGSYEGVSWVSGAITMCIKHQSGIPLSRCHGSGNFN
ncbi:hypothetical protein CORC01_05362 [Colletotrichum orchidophilum]|uniref:Uncharacterized protein n=1 Tax=Colletotrichum orchidophilum TaxID=1209926 RepID=A0A1G4BD63_9PEZI|nr:uncharacterized protein CORC01_05362 [Colletotrichum orchidophilum]OHE99321.1 hypothetical protein CORC01_05362 [Colletotrichum orchidophilum]